MYPSGVHCPTWALQANDPSRFRKLRPARVCLPTWLLALRAGRVTEAKDGIDGTSGTPRCWAAGCSSLGRLFKLLLAVTPVLVIGPCQPCTPRSRVDLEKGQVTAVTAALRHRLLDEFQSWLSLEDPDVASADASASFAVPCGSGLGMQLASLRHVALDRLLRLVAAMRVAVGQGGRLHDHGRDGLLQRLLHSADLGQVPDPWCPHAISAVGCTICGELPKAQLSSHDSCREALA